MKILIISPSPPEYLGGLANFTKGLVENLGRKNIEVDFLCSSLSSTEFGIYNYVKNVKIIKKRSLLFSDNDNFIKLKNPVFNVLFYLIKYGKSYDLIHVHSYIYFSTIQTFIYKLLFNQEIPIVLHLHGGIQTENYQVTNFIERVLLIFKKYFFDLKVGKMMLARCDALISVSKSDLSVIHKIFKVKRKENNFYIPNVININKFKEIQEIEREYIGFIGRLTYIKGIDLFLDVVKRYNKINPQQRFLIIGDGPYFEDVKECEAHYPILFYRKVPHEEIPKYYNQCQIYLQTSRTEGLPTTILEALACETPVIASNVGGVKEVIN
ncbi:MAG: glycosyltransferase family 4 protein, partial [Nanoarchaeota archaeon]